MAHPIRWRAQIAGRAHQSLLESSNETLLKIGREHVCCIAVPSPGAGRVTHAVTSSVCSSTKRCGCLDPLLLRVVGGEVVMERWGLRRPASAHHLHALTGSNLTDAVSTV